MVRCEVYAGVSRRINGWTVTPILRVVVFGINLPARTARAVDAVSLAISVRAIAVLFSRSPSGEL